MFHEAQKAVQGSQCLGTNILSLKKQPKIDYPLVPNKSSFKYNTIPFCEVQRKNFILYFMILCPVLKAFYQYFQVTFITLNNRRKQFAQFCM